MASDIISLLKDYKKSKLKEKQEKEELDKALTSIAEEYSKDSTDPKWVNLYNKIKNLECDLPLNSSYIDWDLESVCPILYGSNKSKSLLMLWLNTTIGEFADNYDYGASLETIIDKNINTVYINELQSYLQEQFLNNFYGLFTLNSLDVEQDETNLYTLNININITNLLNDEKTILSIDFDTKNES